MARLRTRGTTVEWSRPLVMGILNANPDSFSDPGARTVPEVLERAIALVEAGAGALDVGAQSAITNRPPVGPSEEAAAVVPVVRGVVDACPGVLVSVDTFKPAVAEAVLDAGAHLVNDVSGLREPALARLCAAAGAGLVVMHTAAPPLVRRQDPGLYRQVGREVAGVLAERVEAALEAGVDPAAIVVDPGVDFAKTPAQSLALLRDLGPVVDLGRPVLLALSRKDFVGALTRRPPGGRDAGTLGAVAALRHVPDQILRVHDVAATVDMLAVLDAIAGPEPPPADLVLPEELRHQRRPREGGPVKAARSRGDDRAAPGSTRPR